LQKVLSIFNLLYFSEVENIIFVEELDTYLRCFYYWINFDSYATVFDMPEELKSWRLFFNDNQRMFRDIEISADKFGFIHNFGGARAMFGSKEVTTRRMNFFLPFDGLRVYPRLLYSEGYLPTPKDFNLHRYFFTYLPLLLGLFYKKKEDGSEEPVLSVGATAGSHRKDKKSGEHWIAYNVSVPINMGVIIEEELHSHGDKIHGTTNVQEVLKAIQTNDPQLQNEIELNLNGILSVEEQKFRSFGNLMTQEKTPDLRKMKVFNELFEKFLIEHTCKK
jgi:hypothetical protein